MTDTDRVLPHDLAAERAVLGSVLVNGELLAHVQSWLFADDFFRVAHRALFTSMLALSESKTEIDLLTVMAELNRGGWADEVGGAAYVSSLTDGIPRTSNVTHYAKIVKDLARRRALIETGSVLMSEAYDGAHTPDEIARTADAALLTVNRSSSHGRMVDMRESFTQLVDDIEFRTKNRGQLIGLDTGFPSLNELTNGWQAGDMIIVAARPSMGKTVLIMNCAEAAAATGAHVGVFSMEMRRRQLEYRRLSHLSQVPLTRITNGWLGEFDYEKITPAVALMAERAIFVDDRAGQTVADIRASCKRLKAEGRLDMVIVDYVQLITGSLQRRGATRSEELGDISRRLKVLADEVSCPVLVCSQLSRAAEGRADKRPQLSDLRESGAFEQDADIVLFLHRENHRESGHTSGILEKQRNGEGGTVSLSIQRETQTFTDAGPEPEPEKQPPLPTVEVPDKKTRKRKPHPW